MKRSIVLALLQFAALIAAAVLLEAKAPDPATVTVVKQFLRMVKSGQLLSPQGWQAASKLHYQSGPYPSSGVIYLMSTDGAIGQDWSKDNRAQVETKWTDSFGSVDSSLRYHPPRGIPPSGVLPTMTVFYFRLVYTDRHQEFGLDGRVLHEIPVALGWKIDKLSVRSASVPAAIHYLTLILDKTDDPAKRKNATATIAALKRLRVGCGTASAC